MRNRESTKGPLGEDWAEWLVSQIGTHLGLPTAEAVPAVMLHEGLQHRGIVSIRFVDPLVGRLVHGNELLAEAIPGYETGTSRRNPLYTIESVKTALMGVQANPGCDIESIIDGFTLWTGYLVLDALVWGADRHHENWGVIRTESDTVLAPSFDHGNALGFAATSEQINRSTIPGAIENWVAKGKSPHFSGRPTLEEVAHSSLAQIDPSARIAILDRIRSIDLDAIRSGIDSIPPDIMNQERKTFTWRILAENRQRILDGSRTQI